MGVRIEYACEIFPNDDSIAASLLKHMKRVMAAEYSRELSAKVYAATMNCAARGFKMGGTLPYGFQRQIVDMEGRPKAIANFRETKSLANDRVMVIPGSAEEAAVIRRIFKLFTVDRMTRTAIARTLNTEGVSTGNEYPWTSPKVHGILTTRLVLGVYCYNKSSYTLKKTKINNPESAWIKVTIGKPIISQKTFDLAQKLIADGDPPPLYTDAKMLSELKKLLKAKGRLSRTLIDACPTMPNSYTFTHHFGSIERVYALVGYEPGVLQKARLCREGREWTREELLEGLRRLLAEKGRLSNALVLESDLTPSPMVYYRRFGTLTKAYAEIDYVPAYTEPVGKHYRTISPEEGIAGLQFLFEKYGYVSTHLVAETKDVPCMGWYRKNFGTLKAACAAAGIETTPRTLATASKLRLTDLVADTRGRRIRRHIARYKETPDEELIAGVQRLFKTHGYVTGHLINNDPTLPPTGVIYRRYASLKHLYAKAGVIGKSWKRPREHAMNASDIEATSKETKNFIPES